MGGGVQTYDTESQQFKNLDRSLSNFNSMVLNVGRSNLGQQYVVGENDCDIWVQSVLNKAGFQISGIWGGDAKITNVATHLLSLNNSINGNMQFGVSVFFQGNTHVGLVVKSADGSVSLFHQGYNDKKLGSYSKEYTFKNYEDFSSSSWGTQNLQYFFVK